MSSTEKTTDYSDFITIDENSIPQGGDSSKFAPLPEGPYTATCVAMVTGIGTKYQSEETEQKVRFVFAIDENDDIKYVRTNWMKISLWDGEPNPSALWVILSAWTNQKTADKLIAKMGKFDLSFFIGKPITLGLKISKDEKWNIISDYYAPKKGTETIANPEIPQFCVNGDKRVPDGIKYITMEGATIKAPKAKDGAAPAAPATPAKDLVDAGTKPGNTAEIEDDSLPF